MNFDTSKDGILTISICEENQQLLQTVKDESPDDFQSDNTMYDFFEGPLGNSEFNWVSPYQTGDLTDAPMLGLLDNDGEIESRWAFMSYEVESPLEVLLATGRVKFHGGKLS